MEDEERRKRRLRKKLLQIENLEILNRPLNQEEEIKVGKKTQIREELQGLLKGTMVSRGGGCWQFFCKQCC